MILIVFWFVSYLLGSVPSGILLARAMGLGDPRKSGSGNIGASNLTRLGGKRLGALTFLLDFLKGFLPVLFAILYWPENPSAAALGALLAVTGHCYSIFLLFRGGKGVATTAGALFPLAPFAMIAALGAWGLGFYVYRITSLAAMISLFALLAALFVFGAPAPLLGVALVCGVMVVRRHRANLEDLLGGRERSF